MANNLVSGFRADIEGLRAIAVLGVLAFHFQFPFIQGGFAGVDVFFAISGFLITGHLHKELSTTGKIDLWRFYAKRARRLMPMCTTVIIATLVAMYFIYSPIEQREFLSYAGYSAAYLVNFHLLEQALDYFGNEAAANPFLHYWSLAVEEQFYLIWPAILILFSRLSAKKHQRLAFVGIAAASLIACILFTRFNQPVAFYMLPFRIWEFAAGGFLAIARLPAPRRVSLQRLTGILAIISSYLFFTDGMPFPGWLAALPVAGTLLVIRAGQNDTGSDLPSKIVASRPMVTIGRLSYSIYLWHWPVVVFARAFDPDLSLGTALISVIVTFFLSYVSHRLVEVPVRQSKAIIASRGRAVAFMSLAVACAVLSVFVASKIATSSMTEQLVEIENVIKARPTGHSQNGKNCLPGLTSSEVVSCTFGRRDARRTIALFGDSHAEMWSTSLVKVAEKYDWRIVTFLKSSCSAASVSVWHGELNRRYTECDRWRAKAIDKVKQLSPDVVLIGQYSTSYVQARGSPSHKANATAWAQGLHATLDALSSETPDVVLLRDTPVLRLDAPTCSSRAIWWGSSPTSCEALRTTALSEEIARVERDEVSRIANVAYLDLSDLFCDRDKCRAMQDGQTLYRDRHHISNAFALRFAETFADRLNATLSRQPLASF